MESTDKERVAEQWLDAALSEFGKVEPRAGLEKRVMANLEAERSRIASSRRWWWVASVAAAAAVILIGIGIGRANRTAKSAKTNVASYQSSNSSPKAVNEPRAVPKERMARSMPAPRRKSNTAASNTPKLAQFPAPRKFSQEEMQLFSYVQKNPSAAASAQSFARGKTADLHVSSMDIPPLSIQDLAGKESENN